MSQVRLAHELFAYEYASVQWKVDKAGRTFLSIDLGPIEKFRAGPWHVKSMVVYHTQRDTWRVLTNCQRINNKYVPAIQGENFGKFVQTKSNVSRTFVLKRVWGEADKDTNATAQWAFDHGIMAEDAFSYSLYVRTGKEKKLQRLEKNELVGIGVTLPFWWAYETHQWGQVTNLGPKTYRQVNLPLGDDPIGEDDYPF